MHTSVNPSWTILMCGLSGSKLYRHVFVSRGLAVYEPIINYYLKRDMSVSNYIRMCVRYSGWEPLRGLNGSVYMNYVGIKGRVSLLLHAGGSEFRLYGGPDLETIPLMVWSELLMSVFSAHRGSAGKFSFSLVFQWCCLTTQGSPSVSTWCFCWVLIFASL